MRRSRSRTPACSSRPGQRSPRRPRPTRSCVPATRRPSAPPGPTTGSPTCCSTAAGWWRSLTFSRRCSAAGWRCTTTRGACSPVDDHALPPRMRSTAPGPRGAACRPATAGWPSRPPGTSTSARWCCAPTSRWTSPSGAPSNAAPSSRRWSCSSAAARPRPRAGSVASCWPTSSSGRDLDATRLRERARQQGADLDGDLSIAVAEHRRGAARRPGRSRPRSGAARPRRGARGPGRRARARGAAAPR